VIGSQRACDRILDLDVIVIWDWGCTAALMGSRSGRDRIMTSHECCIVPADGVSRLTGMSTG
jgi:hypothetical protein